MQSPIIKIEDWSKGVSLKGKGGAKQYRFSDNINGYQQEGYLTQGQGKFTMLLSGDGDMGETAYSMIYALENLQLYFGATNAKIFKQTNSTSIALEHTSSETGTIQELVEYKGYMYYAQNTTIGRSDLNAPTYVDNWKTGLTSNPHPMCISYDSSQLTDQNVYVGNGSKVDMISGTTYTSNVLDIPDGWLIKDIDNFGTNYIAIGAEKQSGSYPVQAKIFIWDKLADTWNDEIEVPEVNFQAMYYAFGYLWFWAGDECNLYVVPIGSRTPTRMWDFFNPYPNSAFRVYRNAITYKSGRVWFGISGDSEDAVNITPMGVYSFPINPSQFNMNLEYRAIQNDIDITSMQVMNVSSSFPVYFFEKYIDNDPTANTTHNKLFRQYGLANETFYNDSGSVETLEYLAPIGKKFQFDGIGIDTLPIIDGSITVDYSLDNGATWTSVINLSTVGSQGDFVYRVIETYQILLRIGMNSNAQRTPNRIKRVYVTGTEINDPRNG